MDLKKMKVGQTVTAAQAPRIKNGDMTKYAKDLGEYLMKAKLAILSIAGELEEREPEIGKELEKHCDDINHIENELKGWA